MIPLRGVRRVAGGVAQAEHLRIGFSNGGIRHSRELHVWCACVVRAVYHIERCGEAHTLFARVFRVCVCVCPCTHERECNGEQSGSCAHGKGVCVCGSSMCRMG